MLERGRAHLRIAVLALTCILALVASAAAQDTGGTVTIRARGPGGVALAGVLVLVEGDQRSVELTTGADGDASATLPAGVYTVVAFADGFAPVTATITSQAGKATIRTLRITEVEKTEEIVVEDTAPERPRDLERYELSREELRTSAGTNGDALLAVQNLPGVSRPPAMGGGLVVRGAGPNDTAIFVDGTPIPLAFHFGGVNSVIPSEALERLAFVPGNVGPAYGRALGGVVDLGLRSPRRDRIAALAQVDALDARVFVESPLGRRARFFAGARRSWVDAWIGPVLEQAGSSVATAPVYYDAQGVLEVDASDSTTARLAFFGASDRLRLVIDAPMASDPTPGGIGLGSDFWRVQGRTTTRIGRARWVNTVAFGEEKRDLRFGASFIDIDVDVTDVRSELDAQLAPSLALVVGTDLNYQRGDIALRVPPGGDDMTPNPTFGRPPVVFGTSASLFRPAAYTGLEWVPRRDVELYPSLRADYTEDGNDLTLSPRLNARWRLRDAVGGGASVLEAGSGLYFQPPEPGQAQEGFGNPDLANGRALQLGVGAKREFAEDAMVGADVYVKRLDELAVTRPAAGSGVSGSVVDNRGTGLVWGVELSARGALGERASGAIAYSFSRSKRRDGAEAPEVFYELDQTHTLTLLGSLQLGRAWTLSGRFRFSSGTPETPYLGGIVDLDAGAYGAVAGAESSRRLPPFHQLDVRIERRFRTEYLAITGYLDLQNAYNRANPVAVEYNYDYTQRQALAGLPLVPVLGVRGEL